MKAIGAEIIEFYNNHFPDGYYHDDYDESIDMDNLNPNQKYELNDLGYIISDEDPSNERTFSSVFRRWQKKQTHVTLLVSVPREQIEAAKKDIKALGYLVS